MLIGIHKKIVKKKKKTKGISLGEWRGWEEKDMPGKMGQHLPRK